MTDTRKDHQPISQVVAVEGLVLDQMADCVVCIVPVGDNTAVPASLMEIKRQLASVRTATSSAVRETIHSVKQDTQQVSVLVDDERLGIPTVIIAQADGFRTSVFTLTTQALMAADSIQAEAQTDGEALQIHHLVLPVYQQRPSPPLGLPTSIAKLLDQMAKAIESYQIIPHEGYIRKISVVLAPESDPDSEALLATFNDRFRLNG